jgi:hypothetical protein
MGQKIGGDHVFFCGIKIGGAIYDSFFFTPVQLFYILFLQFWCEPQKKCEKKNLLQEK